MMIHATNEAAGVVSLTPTTPRLLEPNVVPYSLWYLGMTVAELRSALAAGTSRSRDELVARILREANTRDVRLFLDWVTIEEAWPRIERRLGRAREVWEMMRERRQENERAASPP
jgi:hypothetical protein